MELRGELRKMKVELDEEHLVNYQMVFFDTAQQQTDFYPINGAIGKELSIYFTGNIYCKKCGKKTKKSFHQGFCYSCFRSAPEAAECIIHPERCRAHLGEGRDPEWEEKHHNKPHVVYLAATNKIKVGITGEPFPVTRWIDQGASQAIVLSRTPNRYLSGVTEVALKQQFPDKTNWRTMLRNEVDDSIDLEETKWKLEELLPEDIAQYISDDDETVEINYPVQKYPEKINSINLEKNPFFQGKLMGIKGQYFLFEGNKVMNIRRHTSYEVEVKILK